jgi:AbrB family looped-hinge helix DNA binding protein
MVLMTVSQRKPTESAARARRDTKRAQDTNTKLATTSHADREPSKVGKRGTVVIPASLRRRYGIEEGSIVIAEAVADGILIRPAVVLPVEVYTPERKAQFLLSNSVDAEDYRQARREVRSMGLDPDTIPHFKPPGV